MKHLLNKTCQWLVALIAMFAVSLSASAQSDLLGNGTKVFDATGTLDGTYTTTYASAKSANFGFVQVGSAALNVTNSSGTKVASAAVSLSGYDVTFTVSGSTATADGAYTFTVPEGYFYTPHIMGNFNNFADKFTINLTGASGGGTVDPVDPGTGGGSVDPVDPTPSSQPLNVTFDFSKGFVAEKDGVTCEYNGSTNSGYIQIKNGQYITFTAPYGYLITEMVLNDGDGTLSMPYTPSTGKLADCDWSEMPYTRTWTGSATSVTFNSTGNGRMKTVAITLVKDPNAKELFAFTGATPAAGTELEKLETFTLGLPADVTDLECGSQISVNGNNTDVTATVNADGNGLVFTFDKAIVTDGSYTIVVPQEFATAASGAINSEYTVQYTVNSPVFELTADNFSPKPGADIEINFNDPLNPETLRTLTISYPAGLEAGTQENPLTVAFKYTDDNGVVTNVSDAGLADVGNGNYSLMFDSKRIEKAGIYTFDFPAGTFTTTSGKTSVAFQLVYEVGIKHFYYNVSLLEVGNNTIPADATITVAGKEYKNHDVITVVSALSEDDVTDTEIEGFIFKSLEVVQPSTYNGSIIVRYEKVVPRVEYTEITPAADVDLDNNGRLSNICIKFPENFSTDYLEAPAGFSLTDPAGQQIALSDSYGFTGWSSSTDLYINFPSQNVLGTYVLDIPEDAITFASGLKNKAIHYEWTLHAEFFNFDRYNGETVKEFTGFTLQAPTGVTFKECNVTKLQHEVGRDEETYKPIYEEVPVSVDFTSSAVTFTFTTTFKEKGSVNLVLPEGAIIATDGRKNREMSFYQYVDPTDYIDIVSTTPVDYTTVDGPLTSIVLNLGVELDPADVIFGETISYNFTNELPVTASLDGKKVTLTFDDANINYDSNNNNFGIPEGFITTNDGAISRSASIWNVRINAPKVPLELTGIRLGSESGELVTESGAKVEKVGVLYVEFAENVSFVEDADLTTITVTDGEGNACELYKEYGRLAITAYDNKVWLWVTPAMTAIDTYTLHIPAGLLVGAETGNANAEINFELVIADIDIFVPETDIVYGDTVDTLTELVLTAPAGVTFSHFTDYPANFFYLTGEGITGDGKIYMQATVAEDGKTATLKLGNIKKNGEYTITVPKGYLRSTTPNEGNAEIVIRVTVDHKVLDWDANDNGIVEVNDVEAAVSAALERGYYGMGGSSDDDAVLKALDLNEDGEITIGEITKLIEQLQPAK